MSRAEKFAMVTAVIGLAADLLTLSTFLVQLVSNIQVVSPKVAFPRLVRTIVLLTLLYGWLVICWFVARRMFSRFSDDLDVNPQGLTIDQWMEVRRIRSRAFSRTVISVTIGAALLVSPFVYILVGPFFSPGDDAAGIFTVMGDFMVTAVIALVIGLGMPAVYPEMNVDPLAIFTFDSSHRMRDW